MMCISPPSLSFVDPLTTEIYYWTEKKMETHSHTQTQTHTHTYKHSHTHMHFCLFKYCNPLMRRKETFLNEVGVRVINGGAVHSLVLRRLSGMREVLGSNSLEATFGAALVLRKRQ